MGFRYFGGKTWAEITREERFFCLQLFARIQERGVSDFIAYLRDQNGYALDPNARWELAYEACFYRDLWHHRGRKGLLRAPKRTFDMALFSDDTIVIIEAKAAEKLEPKQTRFFVADKQRVVKETGVSRVILMGLVSSRYAVSEQLRAVFDGPILTWAELAARYGDPLFTRADSVFMKAVSGKNNVSGYRTGAELLAAFEAGERFFVGRGGGLKGVLKDVLANTWQTQRYQTDEQATVPQSRNWLALTAFADAVRGHSKTR